MPGPAAIAAEARPGGAAERQHRAFAVDRSSSLEEQPVRLPAETLPAVAKGEADAAFAEAEQPGAQQRRGLHCLREHPPAASLEQALPQAFRPAAQRFRRKSADRGRQPILGRTVAPEKKLQWFRMREV